MSVPLEESKIAWSVWEIESGKNDDTEMAADKPADVANAEEMFDMSGGMANPQPDLLDPRPTDATDNITGLADTSEAAGTDMPNLLYQDPSTDTPNGLM